MINSFDSCHGVYGLLTDVYAKYANQCARLLVRAFACLNIVPAYSDSDKDKALDHCYSVEFLPFSGGVSIQFNYIFDAKNFLGFPYDKFCHWLRSCVDVFEVSKFEF